MEPFERQYVNLIQRVLRDGEYRNTRNADTIAMFGTSLTIDMADGFPVLQGRKMYPEGVLGELAAMLRQPKTVQDFKDWGCNYWGLWGDEEGKLNVDYGNAWFDFNGFDQIAALKDMIANDPTNRRMIINSWRPDKLSELSLPCCHYSYQFFVSQSSNKLSMIWTQRSVDVMIGLPSDAVFAAAWLIAIAREFGLEPGTIKMDFGDTHVYADHESAAHKYCDRARTHKSEPIWWIYNRQPGEDSCSFEPVDLTLARYNPAEPIIFKLHG